MAKGQRPERSKIQLEVDREKITKLLLAGWSQADIAKAMDMNRCTVWHDIQVVLKRMHKSQVRGMKRVVALRLAELDRVKRLASEAFAKSQQDQVTLVSQEGVNGKSLTETVRGQTGDPAMLGKILDAIEKQCKLEGLYAPLKLAETDSDGNDLDPEQLESRRSRVVQTLAQLGFFGAIDGDRSGDQRSATDNPELPTDS